MLEPNSRQLLRDALRPASQPHRFAWRLLRARRSPRSYYLGKVIPCRGRTAQVDFEVRDGFTDMEFCPVGMDWTPKWPVLKHRRALAMAPFADAGFIKRFKDEEIPFGPISRAESLRRASSREFDTLVRRLVPEYCRLPIPEDYEAVAGSRDGRDALQIRNSPGTEALPGEDADFDLGLIEPASVSRRVVVGESVPDLGTNFMTEQVGQSSTSMDVQVIHNQMDGFGFRILKGRFGKDLLELDCSAIGRGESEMAAFWLYRAENIGCTAGFIFVVSSHFPGIIGFLSATYSYIEFATVAAGMPVAQPPTQIPTCGTTS